MQYLNRILDHFWTRWKKEYLTEVRDAHSRKRSYPSGSEVDVGDIVLANDPDHPGQASESLRSADGQVRGARIRVGATIRRPTQAFYPRAPP